MNFLWKFSRVAFVVIALTMAFTPDANLSPKTLYTVTITTGARNALGLPMTATYIFSFTFAGWNTKADGTGTNYAAGSTYTMGAVNVTLYARGTSSLYPEYSI